MGRDKATLPLGHATLSQTVAVAVRAAAGNATLVGNVALGGIPDRYPGEGPLGGILTALHHSEAEWNLIVACDMPALGPEFLQGLLDAAEAAGCDVLLPFRPDGRPEPLCAVYRRSARERIASAFSAGTRKVTAGLDGLNIRRIDVGETMWFHNVNTPEDWATYAAG